MKRLGDTWGESTAYQNLGVVCYVRGNYLQAIEYYNTSLKMKSQIGDLMGITDCHVNLGEVYRTTQDMLRAIEHLQEALKLARQIGANQTVGECYRQLAECYLESGNPQRSLEICREAQEHAQNIGDRKEEGLAYRVLGTVYFQLQDYRTSRESFEQGIGILQELNRDFDLAGALCDYAQVLSEAGQTSEAIEKLHDAAALFDKLDLPTEKAKTLMTLEQLKIGGRID
jgi:tetratricopeptide (TPR) repeat protein